MEVGAWCCRVTNNFVQGPNLDALRLQVATHDAVAAVVHMLHDVGEPSRPLSLLCVAVQKAKHADSQVQTCCCGCAAPANQA